MVRAPSLPLQLQLESLRRQLSRRRLPRAAFAQRSRQRSRLQQLHDRKRRALLPAVEPDRDRRAKRRRARCAKASAHSTLDLSKLHDQLYDGVMDTNLVIPRGVDKTEVIFDFYFADVSE